MRFLLDLCWWRPRCRGCGHRYDLLVEMCFDCTIREMEARTWRDIGIAVAALIRAGVICMLEAPEDRQRQTEISQAPRRR